MQPLRPTVDLGAMAMKGYSTFPKAPTFLEPYYHIVLSHIKTLVGGSSYPSAAIQLVYPIAPADLAVFLFALLVDYVL